MRHIECMAKMRNTYRILVGKPQRRDLLGNVSMEGRIMFSCRELWQIAINVINI
jgi:hypothetical protein